jgi:hypothetical protein
LPGSFFSSELNDCRPRPARRVCSIALVQELL